MNNKSSLSAALLLGISFAYIPTLSAEKGTGKTPSQNKTTIRGNSPDGGTTGPVETPNTTIRGNSPEGTASDPGTGNFNWQSATDTRRGTINNRVEPNNTNPRTLPDRTDGVSDGTPVDGSSSRSTKPKKVTPMNKPGAQ